MVEIRRLRYDGQCKEKKVSRFIPRSKTVMNKRKEERRVMLTGTVCPFNLTTPSSSLSNCSTPPISKSGLSRILASVASSSSFLFVSAVDVARLPAADAEEGLFEEGRDGEADFFFFFAIASAEVVEAEEVNVEGRKEDGEVRAEEDVDPLAVDGAAAVSTRAGEVVVASFMMESSSIAFDPCPFPFPLPIVVFDRFPPDAMAVATLSSSFSLALAALTFLLPEEEVAAVDAEVEGSDAFPFPFVVVVDPPAVAAALSTTASPAGAMAGGGTGRWMLDRGRGGKGNALGIG